MLSLDGGCWGLLQGVLQVSRWFVRFLAHGSTFLVRNPIQPCRACRTSNMTQP